jgi:hypothetical protein
MIEINQVEGVIQIKISRELGETNLLGCCVP